MEEKSPQHTEYSFPLSPSEQEQFPEKEVIPPVESYPHEKRSLLNQISTSVARNRRSEYAADAPIVSPVLDSPEVAHVQPLDSVHSPLYFVRHNDDPANGLEVAPQSSGTPKSGRQICGLRRRTFWLLLILAIVVIAAAIGGGVGGAMAAKNQKEAAAHARASALAAATASSSTISPTPSSSSPPTTTSSASAGAPSANSTFVPEPIGYSLRAFSDFDMNGLSQTINTTGYFRLAFVAHSYIWLPGRWTDATRCSVNFCAGDLDLGWRGETETYQHGNRTAARYIDGVVILCASRFGAPSCPSPVPEPSLTVPVVTQNATASATGTAATMTTTGTAGLIGSMVSITVTATMATTTIAR